MEDIKAVAYEDITEDVVSEDEEPEGFEEELTEEEAAAIYDDAVADATMITEDLLDIVAKQNLLQWEMDPQEAVRIAYELWNAVREVAVGIVSAELAGQGIPFDLTYLGQRL
jgi:hypothetical protein